MQRTSQNAVETGVLGTRRVSVKMRTLSLGAVYGFAFSFLAVSVLSVWAAYDGQAALTRFFLLLSGVLCVLIAPTVGRRLTIATTTAVVAILGDLLVLGVALLYTGQWFRASFASVELLARWPALFSDNLAAQLLAIGLPLAAASLLLGLRSRRWVLTVVGALALVTGISALVLTGSRGAWISVASAVVVALYLVVRNRLLRSVQPGSVRWLRVLDVTAIFVAVSVLLLFAAIVAFPDLDSRLAVSAQGGSAASRIALWRDSIPLIADYFFTGSGLASTAMVYVTYSYLLHVPFLYHAHNFYLQMALEQGVPALLSWGGLVIATAFFAAGAMKRAEWTGRVVLIAGFASLVAFLVHGFFEAELYFSMFGGLIFLTPVVLLWVAASVYEGDLRRYGRRATGADASGAGVVLGLLVPAVVVLLVPGAMARWEANLGAVLQTRTELGVYRWPEWSFQDQVRVVRAAELAPAVAHFQTALDLDPNQGTAHRRLGQIALANGDLAQAEMHLAVAHAVMPGDRAARQLMGELYALDGELDDAANMWRGLDVSQGQLTVRQWWYEAFGKPGQAGRLNDAIQSFERSE